MMKNVLVSIVVTMILCALMISITGCSFSQDGETAAEGHRRHLRNLRIGSKQMAEDIDTVMMTDQPSKLNELRNP